MDEALKKMKRGGKAELRISREALSESTILPPGSEPVDLLVTIELAHMENLKESWELKGAAKLTQCETLKEKGNTVFKAGEYERALRRYTTAKTLAESNHDLSDEDKATASALKLTLLNK
jgi:FK506-binding protein 4/5